MKERDDLRFYVLSKIFQSYQEDLVYHFTFLSPSLWETARYRLKYCPKGPLSPKQPTNSI